MNLIPPQYLLLAKIGVLSAFLIGVYVTGHHQGAKGVQSDWDASKAQFIDAQSKLIQEHAKEIEALRQKQDQTNIQVSEDHEKAITEIQKKHDADLAAVRASGGLRLPRSVCNPAVTRTEAPGDSGHHEDVADTIALPDKIANDLFDFAADADRTTEIARACQNWIRQNGFYGTVHTQP